MTVQRALVARLGPYDKMLYVHTLRDRLLELARMKTKAEKAGDGSFSDENRKRMEELEGRILEVFADMSPSKNYCDWRVNMMTKAAECLAKDGNAIVLIDCWSSEGLNDADKRVAITHLIKEFSSLIRVRGVPSVRLKVEDGRMTGHIDPLSGKKINTFAIHSHTENADGTITSTIALQPCFWQDMMKEDSPRRALAMVFHEVQHSFQAALATAFRRNALGRGHHLRREAEIFSGNMYLYCSGRDGHDVYKNQPVEADAEMAGDFMEKNVVRRIIGRHEPATKPPYDPATAALLQQKPD